jgi:hypothetical protein
MTDPSLTSFVLTSSLVQDACQIETLKIQFPRTGHMRGITALSEQTRGRGGQDEQIKVTLAFIGPFSREDDGRKTGLIQKNKWGES